MCPCKKTCLKKQTSIAGAETKALFGKIEIFPEKLQPKYFIDFFSEATHGTLSFCMSCDGQRSQHWVPSDTPVYEINWRRIAIFRMSSQAMINCGLQCSRQLFRYITEWSWTMHRPWANHSHVNCFINCFVRLLISFKFSLFQTFSN